jgi:hypothetical protein
MALAAAEPALVAGTAVCMQAPRRLEAAATLRVG